MKTKPGRALARNSRILRVFDDTQRFGGNQLVKASKRFMTGTAAKIPGGGDA
jgi:hypothetical protein